MSGRGRKPDPEVDARIRQAAVSLLFSKGPSFTVDEVAAAAGVGRASVFRRYATKRDILLDALGIAMDAQVTAVPDTGSLAGDLVVIATETLAAWDSPEIAERTREIFGEAGRDPAIAEIIRTAMRSRMERSWEIYDRAIARGSCPPTRTCGCCRTCSSAWPSTAASSACRSRRPRRWSRPSCEASRVRCTDHERC
ncbi:TetR-like C-terminal domain-containing protein [Actinomadura namibiensis]|uniref:TetR-like C-terminal domain-containing protein n=1 Tax=Actinomadura kijaniata TaxID=46161 RepID=UPI003611DB10